MTAMNPPRRMSASDAIRQAIEERIFNGDLKPGEKINQLTLSHGLDVSLTIVREALLSLEADGLVYNVHRRGIFVADFSPEDIHALFVVRKHMENLISELVIQNAQDHHIKEMEDLIHRMKKRKSQEDYMKYWEIDVEFHNYMLSIANNKYLTSFAESLSKKIRFIRFRAITQRTRMEESINYHIELVKCVKNKDLASAIALISTNLDRVENILVSQREN